MIFSTIAMKLSLYGMACQYFQTILVVAHKLMNNPEVLLSGRGRFSKAVSVRMNRLVT